MKTHPFAGGTKKPAVTKRHTPLIWEGILGTVYARNAQGEVKYFDYDYDGAREFAGVAEAEDLRVSKTKLVYQGYPRYGQLALWGIRK